MNGKPNTDAVPILRLALDALADHYGLAPDDGYAAPSLGDVANPLKIGV
jgi:hypothetical protein